MADNNLEISFFFLVFLAGRAHAGGLDLFESDNEVLIEKSYHFEESF